MQSSPTIPNTPENRTGADPFAGFFEHLMRYTELLDQRTAALQDAVGLLSRPDTPEMIDSVKHAVSGVNRQLDLSIIQPLLDDPSINDILINGPTEIFVERQGNIVKTDIQFADDEQLFHFADQIVTAVGRKLDPHRPLVDARLPDGSRVNIIAPPLAIDGISISIRKFSSGILTLDKLAESGSMSQQIADFLKVAAAAKVNIVISGGTGSGKTTLLNAIAQHIRPVDRIVTIEDSAELRLPLPHIVRLESMEADEMGRKHVPMRDLVKNALRMRPDRIIVGEVRGAEAFDMIQAMNTGHDGSFTTIHANAPRDGLARLENMISMANLSIPTQSVRKQLASAINFIIQISRLEDGTRKLQKVTEIVGMEGEVITMQDLFSFKQTGMEENGKIIGQHVWAGIFPRHADLNRALREAGMLTLVANAK